MRSVRRVWVIGFFSVFLICLICLLAVPASGANIIVPSLELYTWGAMRDDAFGLISNGEMDLLVEGGYKFGGRVVLGFDSSNLETSSLETSRLEPIPLTGGLSFKSASVMVRDLFGQPLSFTYFIGEGDLFCSGDLFPEFFGIPPVATSYRGFIHFPEGIEYEGIHLLNGTGTRVDLLTRPQRFLLSFYLYQDSQIDTDGDPYDLEPGHYSLDVRSAFNFEQIKLEAFLGATYPAPVSTAGYYRSGLLFFAQDVGVEFLAQVGIPRWSPFDEALEIDYFYLLLEPRAHLGLLSIIPTFFWHPAYYRQQATEEQAFDINLNLQIGNISRSTVSGGVENNFSYQIEENEFQYKLSPYVQIAASGVLWEVRMNANLWPYSLSELFEGFLAIQAEF